MGKPVFVYKLLYSSKLNINKQRTHEWVVKKKNHTANIIFFEIENISDHAVPLELKWHPVNNIDVC